MSKDIRSFFLPKSKKTEQTSYEASSNKKNKKRAIIIDSDSDEPVEITPKKQKKNTVSDRKSSEKKKTEKLKPVNVSDLFGSEKIKRSGPNLLVHKESNNTSKISRKELENIHSDEEFEATLRQIDEIEVAALSNHEVKTVTDPYKPKQECSEKHSKFAESFKTSEKTTPRKQSSPEIKDIYHQRTKNKEDKQKEDRSQSPEGTRKESPKKTASHTESPTDSAEKKRLQALSYMKYLNRGGPKHLGSKEVPKGKTGCLSGLVFVISGVLDSLERQEATELIEQYGGKVTSSVSRNTSYLIQGEEAGQSKLNKAEKMGTPLINENGLFNLIVSRSENIVEKHKIVEANRTRKQDEGSSAHDEHKQSKNRKVESKLEQTDAKQNYTSKIVHKSEDCSQKILTQKSDIQKHSSTLGTKDDTHHSESGMINETRDAIDFASIKSSLWVDKYKPTKIKQIIGQQGDRSSLKKLTTWLQNWHKNHSGNKKHIKPSPWAKNDDGAFFKAALLSGPPGIGKTTMAHLVSKELGFDVVEFNASDTRSKKLLHLEISELLSSKTLFGYFHPESGEHQPSVKHVLLMDEVDGMAGNEDRGGVQELIQLIKNTRVPIVCMCNDRNHPKIRSLANYCFDLRVMKPRLEQIRGAMMSVCYKEGLKITTDALNDIICGANFDIRQILHHLSLWSVKEKQFPSNELHSGATKPRKDTKIGPWDVVKKVFSVEDHKTMSIHDKSDLFFHDYSINPLFVQENYLSVSPAAGKGSITRTLQCIAATAESISMGDIVDKSIRSRGSWSLLPVQAMFSSVIPGNLMEGYMRGQINFPAWLGKNSRTGKLDRLLQELHVHSRLSTSGSKQALNLEYLPYIRDAIIRPLIVDGSTGVPETLSILQSYNLLREDLESILELTAWPNQKDPMSAVESKVKAALTRAYNKEGIMTPYSVVNVVKKRSTGISSDDYEDAEEEDEDEEDDVSVDAMIKTKKRQKISVEVPAKDSVGKGKGGNDTNSRGNRKRGRGRGK